MDVEFIPQEAVTSHKLKELFDRAFINCDIDEDDDLRIREEFTSFIQVDSERKTLRYLILFTINEDAEEIKRLAFANAVNRYIYCSASVNNRSFTIENHVSYEKGISDYQIVRTYKRFMGAASEAVERENNKYQVIG